MGVAMFDAEHRIAVELANRLQEAVAKGESEIALRHVLRRLARYSEEHFAHEEEYMRLSGYPDLERHHTVHERLKSEIVKFETTLQSHAHDREALAAAVVEFIQSWLIEHIRTDDQLLGAYLNTKGIR